MTLTVVDRIFGSLILDTSNIALIEPSAFGSRIHLKQAVDLSAKGAPHLSRIITCTPYRELKQILGD